MLPPEHSPLADVLIKLIFVSVLTVLAYAAYLLRTKRIKEHLSVVDDPKEFADTDIVGVNFGLRQVIEMDYGFYKLQWQHMTKEEKKKLVKQHGKLVAGREKKIL